MNKTIYELPVPSTSLLRDVELQEKFQRTCTLVCQYEEGENVVELTMNFENTEAFKCTYYMACSLEIIEAAYDKVVDLGNTKWLEELKTNLRSAKRDTSRLSHLAIYFDDGPAYEFICGNFNVKSRSIS